VTIDQGDGAALTPRPSTIDGDKRAHVEAAGPTVTPRPSTAAVTIRTAGPTLTPRPAVTPHASHQVEQPAGVEILLLPAMIDQGHGQRR
jgi:hypothetical protein